MGFIDRIATRASVSGSAHPRDPVVASWWGGYSNAAGQVVTPDTAMGVSAVFACVRVIAESVAQLPLILYRQLDEGKERAKDHPLYRVLHTRPNRWQTPYEFKRMITGHAVLRGTGYAKIVAANGKAIDEVVPLHPDRIRPFWAPNGMPAYEYQPLNGPARVFLSSEMLVIRGYSDDGLVGINPIQAHRQTIGLTLAMQEHAGALFSNGVRPSGLLKMASHFKDDEARKRFKKSFREAYAGSAKSGETIVLEDGLDWTQMGMNSEDAQFIETANLQRSQIAAIFRVPPHKIGDLSRATNNNIEDQSKSFIEDTLGPWITGFEQAITRDLIDESLQEELFAEFVLEALLRGNIETRYKAYSTGRQWGWLSANDVRRKENMNSIAQGGDEYIKPVNMMPLGMALPSKEGGNDGN